MRLCRYQRDDQIEVGFYEDDHVVPLAVASHLTGVDLPTTNELISLLPNGAHQKTVAAVEKGWNQLSADEQQKARVAIDQVKLLTPVANPNKLLLLAGNYAKHIEEGGGHAEERNKTFPYVFMKPPGTTMTHPGDPVKIPAVSPDRIDWEIELAVIIGRECKGVAEADALDYVAGYTVVNDISDRGFRPNPGRNERNKDSFFDWLHGKWHDTFCPMGPCVLPANEIPDPQQLHLELKVSGNVEQNAQASGMIFPVKAIVAFISSFVTLLPGDVIATGTPAGVGSGKGKFLKSGDVLEAKIDRIGLLRNPVE